MSFKKVILMAILKTANQVNEAEFAELSTHSADHGCGEGSPASDLQT